MAAHLLRPPLPFAESDPQGKVPPGLREIVLRQLAKKPEERIATAEELAERLAPFAVPVPAGTLDALLATRQSDETVASGPATRHVASTAGDADRDPSTWSDGVAPTVGGALNATRRTVQPDAPPRPSPPRRSGYTTVPADEPPAPPPPVHVPVQETPAEPPIQRKGRGGLLAAVIAGVLAVGGLGYWLAGSRGPVSKPVPQAGESRDFKDGKDSKDSNDNGGTVATTATAEPEGESASTYTMEPEAEETSPPAEETVAPSGNLPAQPIQPPRPEYPSAARGTGLTVRATVDFEVDATGQVLEANVPFLSSAKPIPDNLYRDFRDAALKAARRTHFQPARRNGVAVGDKVRLVVELRPEE
jgi:TonB family protein